MRTVTRLQEGKWQPCSFSDLKPGDRFQLWEEIPPCGDQMLVVNAKGQSQWTAASLPYINDQGVETIKVYTIEEDE